MLFGVTSFKYPKLSLKFMFTHALIRAERDLDAINHVELDPVCPYFPKPLL